jgi:hypothetical protein
MFRRRKAGVDPTGRAEPAEGTQAPEEEGAEPDPRARGPWDSAEVSLDEGDGSRIDLGSLLIAPHPSLDVQLQVDEASEQVMSVVLRAFAAPRNGDIWESSRRSVAAEVTQLGGTATERQGPWGPALLVSMLLELPDGQRVPQESLVIGISGPRWLLRATMFGRPVVEYDEDGDVETALRDVVVVRGGAPVPPGDPLPLTMPSPPRRTDPPAL